MSPVFVTFSATDLQWEDLHRHFPGYSATATGDDRIQYRFTWDMVQNHPHIVAHYLILGSSFLKSMYCGHSLDMQTSGPGTSGRLEVHWIL
jgi:hypothetical protein